MGGWRQSSVSLAAVTTAMMIAGTAQAQVNSWVGPAAVSASWETGANWSLGTPPAGEPTLIDNGGIAHMTTYNGNALFLQLGSDPGLSGTVIQDGGTLSLAQGLVLGGATAAAPTTAGVGTYVMNGGQINDADNFIGSKGVGTFTMNDGTIVSGAHMRVGDDKGSTGVLNMHGGQIFLPGFLLVGHFNPDDSSVITTGTMNMDGGTITVANFNIGQHVYARGAVHQSGGWIQNTANTVIGEVSRQPNLYDLNGGTLRIAGGPSGGTLYAGSSAGIGELEVSGTGNAQIDAHLFAGSGTTSIGTVGLSDNGVITLGLNKPGGGFFVAGEFGTATVRVSGGTFTGDYLQLGRRFNATSHGELTQTGGSFTVRRSITVGGLSANGNFYDISAGSLNVTNDLSQGTLGDDQSGVHVARFSVDPGSVTPVVGYSSGRFTVSGTALVNIAGGLYNSTGQTPGSGANMGVPLPGGAGLIEMKGGTLNAGSFLNGAVANAGSYNNGGGTANYVQTGGTATVGPVTGTGNVSVSAGTMNVSSMAQASVIVSGGAVNVAANGGPTGTSRVKALSVSGSGKMDLADNDLVVDYTGSSPLASIRASIVSAYNSGAWTGNGLTSSSAAAASSTPNPTALGYAEATAVGLNGGTFSGQSIDNDAVLVGYTYAGDANLDFVVDTVDFNLVAANFSGTGKSWNEGDFNYDGSVDTVDFNLVAANFGLSLPASSGVGTLVPEPSSAAMLLAAASVLARRRRRA
jgi:hypothetical protein